MVAILSLFILMISGSIAVLAEPPISHLGFALAAISFVGWIAGMLSMDSEDKGKDHKIPKRIRNVIYGVIFFGIIGIIQIWAQT